MDDDLDLDSCLRDAQELVSKRSQGGSEPSSEGDSDGSGDGPEPESSDERYNRLFNPDILSSSSAEDSDSKAVGYTDNLDSSSPEEDSSDSPPKPKANNNKRKLVSYIEEAVEDDEFDFFEDGDELDAIQKPRKTTVSMTGGKKNGKKVGPKAKSKKKKLRDDGTEENTPPPLRLQLMGILPAEDQRLKRIDYLRSLSARSNSMVSCKFCSVGDDDENGLTPENMKKIYKMEAKYKRRMPERQFIKMIVDKYNETVFSQNMIYNTSAKIPELTYDEYEAHMKLCGNSVVDKMWERVNVLEEESNTLRRQGARYMREDGVIIPDRSAYRIITLMEKQIHLYMRDIELSESRKEEVKRKELENSRFKGNRFSGDRHYKS